MQSSLGGVFRSLVLLSCLVAVPLVATSGTWLQDLVKKVSDSRSRISSAGSPKSSDEAPALRANASARRDGSATGTLLGGWPSLNSTADKTQAASLRRNEEHVSRMQGVIPTVFNEQLAPAHGSVGPSPMPEQATQGRSRQDVGRFRQVEQRLRALGAVHYLLEEWGDDGGFYEFRCRMPIASSLTAVRYFEATDSDGLRAMSRVLSEIEAWKAAAPQ